MRLNFPSPKNALAAFFLVVLSGIVLTSFAAVIHILWGWWGIGAMVASILGLVVCMDDLDFEVE